MKFKKEFTFTAKDEGAPNIIITGLTVKSILSYITYLCHYLYSRLMQEDPDVGKAFRNMLVMALTDDRSPVWGAAEPIPGAAEICFTVQDKNQEEAHEEES